VTRNPENGDGGGGNLLWNGWHSRGSRLESPADNTLSRLMEFKLKIFGLVQDQIKVEMDASITYT
jgi:hypothetical protein